MDAHCKVYLWKRWFSPGHIAFELPNKMYISFWPRPKGQKSVLTASGTIYSALTDEIKVNGHPSKILLVPDLDVQKIAMWWVSFSNEQHKWDLASLNCSDIVLDALQEGSDWFKNKSGVLPNTPAGVADIVQEYVDEKLGVPRQSSSAGCIIL